MNLDVLKQSLTNTAANIGQVLAEWSHLDSTLKAHYSDELVRILVEAHTAIEELQNEANEANYAANSSNQ